MKQTYNDSNYIKRKSLFIPVLIVSIFFVLFIVVGSIFLTRYFHKKALNSPTSKALAASWKVYDYDKVYELSRQMLETNPFNNIALVYHGYSSFYLAVSQLDNSTSQNYLDEAINSLRLALVNCKKSIYPQINYMLGKSYFYKNTVTSYYYADLAVKYLKEAQNTGYKANDIPEYLGLTYASLGMTMESISAFTEALIIRESDSLLLSIAEQYYKAGQPTPAKQYLFRIIKDCENEELVFKSRILLGTIYIDEKKYAEARNEFESVLKNNPNSADAYYGLGVIYEKQGDLVKARAEWRKALRLQVNHAGALAKIAEY
jgi:tetratricopeptide (TPR) repeat protein